MKKRALALFFSCMMPLCFFGCKAKEDGGVPIIQTSFDQTGQVTVNGTSYPCRISRTDTADLVIEMLEGAPNAGVVYACSANNTMVTLDNMTFTFTPEELQKDSFIYVMSSLFNAMTRRDSLGVTALKDGGFQYMGNCKAGDFTVTQHKDYSYNTIQVGPYQVQFDPV